VPVPNQITNDPAVDRNFRSIQDQITALQNTRVNADEPNLKMIRGRVDTGGTGTILHGTGFTIVRTGVGSVTVTFTTAFSGVPAATATSNVNETAIGSGSTTAEITVASLNTSGVLVDSIFNFIAIGPA